MASRTAILCLLAAAFAAPRAAAQFPAAPPGPGPGVPAPDPNFANPLLTPPDPFPRGGVPSFPPAPRAPAHGVPAPAAPPLAADPGGPDVFLPEGSSVLLPAAKKQVIQFSPRYGSLGDIVWHPVGDGCHQLVYTGGIIISVTYTVVTATGPEYLEYEFATDNLVMWVKGLTPPDAGAGVVVDPAAPADRRVGAELFLKGNVVVRSKDNSTGTRGQTQSVTRTLRADQVYYDVENNRAIALDADLELAFDRFPDTAHVYGKEIQRLGRREWRAVSAGVFASKLPSDPAIRMVSGEVRYVERDDRPRNIFGLPYRTLTGDPDDVVRTVTARNARVTFLGVPVFYTPFYRGDVTEPLGPLTGVAFGNDRVFGTQVFTTLDVYKLLALRPPAGHSWRLHADYLSLRGPAFGTDYAYRGPSLFGFGGPVAGDARFYGLHDEGKDLGIPHIRGPEPPRPNYRFRARWRHTQTLYDEREPGTLLPTGWTVRSQNQFAWLSDKNFLEAFTYIDFAQGPNYETFSHLTASNGPVFASLLAQGGQHRDWVSETRWLPRADAALVGRSVADRFVYNARASAAYAESLPAFAWPPPVVPTDRRINTGRVNLQQELSAPFDLGPVRLAPYGVLDLTGYSRDLTGAAAGRVYGGAGARAAVTGSRAYPDAASEFFNVRGLNHKVTLTGNYLAAESNVPYTQLPLLDRLNDDHIDLAQRTMRPLASAFLPGRAGPAVQSNAPVFDPQRYAIRRLVDNRVDTLDDIHVVQVGVDQRLQTKRGFPGMDHTVDWMTLYVSASLFPDPDRDNFGQGWSFLEYNYLWNVGDRTAFQSAGWFDPFDPGTNFFNAGIFLSRPDKTTFYFGYRQTDPLNSKTVIGAVSYPLTPKYAVTVSTVYDFGLELGIANGFTLVRTGTDLTVSVGFTYNPIVENFGVQFSVVPSLVSDTVYGRPGRSSYINGR